MKGAAQRKIANPPVETLVRLIRDQKVMLDHDLANLYEVSTKALNQAVRRNLQRFPEDFMFQLSSKESELLRSQIVTSNKNSSKPMRSQFVTASKRNVRYQPLAFTEHGMAMLSSVLRSSRAIQMNIMIMRAFTRMRELIVAHKDLAVRIEKLERSHERTDSIIEVLVEDIDRLSRDIRWIKNPPLKPKHRIGFFVEKKSDV